MIKFLEGGGLFIKPLSEQEMELISGENCKWAEAGLVLSTASLVMGIAMISNPIGWAVAGVSLGGWIIGAALYVDACYE
jgi:hypothetical protein